MENSDFGFKKDGVSITSDWDLVNQSLIEGVRTKEIKNVLKNNGVLTEVWRKSWNLDGEPVEQVFQVTLSPGEFSSWHLHEFTTDRLFVNIGTMKIVLYDTRKDSPTYGLINEFNIGALRPMIIIIPPLVCHGIKNIGNEMASVLNLVDQAYTYQDPDHWRIPENSDLIPYSFLPKF